MLGGVAGDVDAGIAGPHDQHALARKLIRRAIADRVADFASEGVGTGQLRHGGMPGDAGTGDHAVIIAHLAIAEFDAPAIALGFRLLHLRLEGDVLAQTIGVCEGSDIVEDLARGRVVRIVRRHGEAVEIGGPFGRDEMRAVIDRRAFVVRIPEPADIAVALEAVEGNAFLEERARHDEAGRTGADDAIAALVTRNGRCGAFAVEAIGRAGNLRIGVRPVAFQPVCIEERCGDQRHEEPGQVVDDPVVAAGQLAVAEEDGDQKGRHEGSTCERENARGPEAAAAEAGEEAIDGERRGDLHGDDADRAEPDHAGGDADVRGGTRKAESDHEQEFQRRHGDTANMRRMVIRMDRGERAGQQLVIGKREKITARGIVDGEIARQERGHEEQAHDRDKPFAAIGLGQRKDEIATFLGGERLRFACTGSADDDPDGQHVEDHDDAERQEGCARDRAARLMRFLAVKRCGLEADEGDDDEGDHRADAGIGEIAERPDIEREGGKALLRDDADVEDEEDGKLGQHEEHQHAGRQIKRTVAEDRDQRHAAGRNGHPRNIDAELVEEERGEIAEGGRHADRVDGIGKARAVGGNDASRAAETLADLGVERALADDFAAERGVAGGKGKKGEADQQIGDRHGKARGLREAQRRVADHRRKRRCGGNHQDDDASGGDLLFLLASRGWKFGCYGFCHPYLLPLY